MDWKYDPEPGQRPPRRRHLARRILLGVVGLVAALVVIGALASHGKPSPAASPPASTSSSAPAAAPASSVKSHTVATFSGSGDLNTARFTVSDTWKLAYSFDCSRFGYPGNFAVVEDGGSDFGGVSVNDLSKGKKASSWAYHDAGTHYLGIISECSWKVRVIDES